MLGPALLLQRMVHFAESVDGRSESESGANHLQHRGLLALVIACLNILRLKAAEVRGQGLPAKLRRNSMLDRCFHCCAAPVLRHRFKHLQFNCRFAAPSTMKTISPNC